MRALLTAWLVVFSVSPVFAARGAGDVSQGNALYRKGKYQDAIKHYEKAAEKNPSEAKIEYDLGAAFYKAGDFDAAADHFQKGLLTDDEKLKPAVYYNAGDAYYRAGIAREDKDVGEAIKRLELSLGSFEKAMAIDTKDIEAKENYEFVKKEIERLKKKQQQQQKQKQQQSKSDQQKQDQAQSQNELQKPGQDQKDGQHEKPQQQSSSQDQKQKTQDQKTQDQKTEAPKQGPEKDAAAGQNKEGQISSQKDANDMIDELERNELPKGLLNVVPQAQASRAVVKDW